jgi:hypothetical protein
MNDAPDVAITWIDGLDKRLTRLTDLNRYKQRELLGGTGICRCVSS